MARFLILNRFYAKSMLIMSGIIIYKGVMFIMNTVPAHP